MRTTVKVLARIAKALAKLAAGVLKCHAQQVNAAFKSGTGASDEDCEDGASSKSPQGRFAAALVKLDSAQLCAGTPSTTVARDLSTTLVAELDGPRNATLYCDGALPIDPNGNDLGTIDPTSKD